MLVTDARACSVLVSGLECLVLTLTPCSCLLYAFVVCSCLVLAFTPCLSCCSRLLCARDWRSRLLDWRLRQQQAWLRQALHTVELSSPTLEAEGKTMRGDEDDDEAMAEEADGEDDPDWEAGACFQIPVMEEEELQAAHPQYASVTCGQTLM